MDTNPSVTPPLTAARWAEIVKHTAVAEPDPLVRRTIARSPIRHCAAKLMLQVATDPPGPLEFMCAVLEISPTGIMVRTNRELTNYTPLGIEIYLGDEVYRLGGKVQHCTQTVGAYKVGIELLFDVKQTAAAGAATRFIQSKS